MEKLHTGSKNIQTSLNTCVYLKKMVKYLFQKELLLVGSSKYEHSVG